MWLDLIDGEDSLDVRDWEIWIWMGEMTMRCSGISFGRDPLRSHQVCW